MDEFSKVLIYVGQNYKFHKREKFHIDEFLQVLSPNRKEATIKDFVSQGLLLVINEEILSLSDSLKEMIGFLDEEVYKTGVVGGGNLNMQPMSGFFTSIVQFDCTNKFSENKKISYLGKELFLECSNEGQNYIKGFTKNEADLQGIEETINRFISHLSYYLNIAIYITAVHSGTGNISAFSKSVLPKSGIFLEIPRLSDLDERQYKCLAFFRQYLNFSRQAPQTTESRYYQLLSIVKILEGVTPVGNATQQRNEVENLLAKFRKNKPDLEPEIQLIEKELLKKGLQGNFEKVISDHYRNGISHWRVTGNFLDPDQPDYILERVLNILGQIIKDVIKLEYKI